jgi:hypothetical protein
MRIDDRKVIGPGDSVKAGLTSGMNRGLKKLDRHGHWHDVVPLAMDQMDWRPKRQLIERGCFYVPARKLDRAAAHQLDNSSIAEVQLRSAAKV